MAKTTLITGVAGFLGSLLAEELLQRGYTVLGIDDLSGGDMRNLPDGVNVAFEDCRDRTTALASFYRGVDVVYHCAAFPHEGLSFFSPSTITDSILSASVSVFSHAIAAGVKRIVFCSSMARYGAQTPPFTEDLPPKPVDPYGIAKVAAEDTLRVLCATHGVEYVIAVPHNIVGRNQRYWDPYRNVCAIMANRMLQGERPIIYGDGEQTRSFSDARDVVPGLAQLGLEPGISGHVFNLGPGPERAVSVNYMSQLLAKILNVPWQPIYHPARVGEVKNAYCMPSLWLDRNSHTLPETLDSLVSYILRRGPRPFDYHLPIEIESESLPTCWRQPA